MEITIPYYEDNTRISNSSLGWFLESPRYFRDYLDGKIEKPATKSMDAGSMIHMYLLQKDEFWKNYVILDFETPTSAQQKKFAEDYVASTAENAVLRAVEAFKANYSTKGKSDDKVRSEALEMAVKLKHYIKFLRSSMSHTVISWADHTKVKTIEENVMVHKKAKELLFNYPQTENVKIYNEFHINWEFTNKYLIKCKSLIDRLIIDHDQKKILLIDIKTTSSIKDFKQSVDKYDYYRQMCYYWMAITWYFKEELKLDIDEYSSETYIVAIQSNGSHQVKVFKLNDDYIIEKINIITNILSDISYHMSTNSWDFSRAYYEGDGVEILE